MSPEERRLLEETHRLAIESRDLTLGLVRRERWRQISWWLKWLVLLGVAGWLYFKIEPFLRQVAEIYQTVFPNLSLPFLSRRGSKF